MLWSLVKVLIFVAVIAAVAFGAVQLLNVDGGVQITAGGTELTLGALETVILVVLLGAAGWVVVKALAFLIATLKFINGDETAISRYFDRNRERKGFQALSEGLMALASGEGRLAMTKAKKAEGYLRRPELTNLITAQAAEMTGDTSKASTVYKQLLKNDATRFVGVRGIMKQKLDEGDTDTALALAEKAFALKPKHEEMQDTLLKLQAQKEDWTGARETLGAKLKYGSLPRDVHKRRDAVLTLSEARDMRLEGKMDEAHKLSIEANRLSPELIPAATLAARAYVEQKQPKLATRVLKAAWAKQPHPEIAAAFAAVAEDESSDARIKRFKMLTKSTASDPETKMVMAELYIAAEDFPEARRALGDLVETDPTVRSLTIMAAIEKGEGASDTVVRGWLTRALSAPRDAQWICDVCGNIQDEWDAVCEECGAIDTFAWKRPPAASGQGVTTAAMMPLLTASPADEAADEEPELPDAEVVDAELVSDSPAETTVN